MNRSRENEPTPRRAPPTVMKPAASWRAPTILLYGSAEVGKTTLAGSAPSPLMLSCEDGIENYAGAAKYIRTIYDLEASIAEILGDMQIDPETNRLRAPKDYPYRTIVVDAIDRTYFDGVNDAMLNKLWLRGMEGLSANKNPATRDPRAAHHVAKDHVAQAIHDLHRIPLPVIITCHERRYTEQVKKRRNGWTETIERKHSTMDLSPRVHQLLWDTVDLAYYCWRDEETGDRLMSCAQVFREDRRVIAKDRTGFLSDNRAGVLKGFPRGEPIFWPMEWGSIAGAINEYRSAMRQKAEQQSTPAESEKAA